MRRGVLVAAAAAAALSLLAAGPAAASSNLAVGITDEAALLWGPTAKTIATYRRLHVQVARMDLYWGGQLGVANAKPRHPADPADSAYDWSIYDLLVRHLAAAGIKVIFTIYGTPSWANGGRARNVAPRNPADLRAFAEAAARRYSGRFVTGGIRLPAVSDWLAWNEPNNPIFLAPQYRRVHGRWTIASAEAYARICNAVYRGVHATRIPGERVGCGVTAPRGNNDPASSRPSVAPLVFLRAVKKDGLRTFDAWADHPYPAYPAQTPAQGDAAGGAVELGDIDTLIRLVTTLYGPKPIWVTEYGYETNPPDAFFGVSWRTQAQYLTQAFAIARRNPRIDMMLWYLLKDDSSPSGWQSGLETAAGVRKPSFAAFARIALAQERRAFAVRRRPSSSGTAGS